MEGIEIKLIKMNRGNRRQRKGNEVTDNNFIPETPLSTGERNSRELGMPKHEGAAVSEERLNIHWTGLRTIIRLTCL